MNEEVIVSGRMNQSIDPVLHIWEWEIPLYLFVGGLAAGILFFTALYTIRGKASELRTAVKLAPFITPFLLITGLIALFIDLNHKPYFWQLYTTIKMQSPMSWGAWTLMVVTPLSFLWCGAHMKEVFPRFNWAGKISFLFKPFITKNDGVSNWEWKWGLLRNLETYILKNRTGVAWIMIIFSVILGIYTGILLSAFNARPLWNTSILGPLFLASGLSTGAATILLMSSTRLERRLFSRIDLILIGIELFIIIHMFMGFLASTQVQIDAAAMFLGGPYTLPFWVFVVFLGLVLPAALEALELKGYHIPSWIPPLLVLTGGVVLRFIIVYAGQATRYLY